MGCFVVQKYLEKHHAPAAVLIAPSTPQGVSTSTSTASSSTTDRAASFVPLGQSAVPTRKSPNRSTKGTAAPEALDPSLRSWPRI
jgi:hypothetical protein